jgi:hypothetical protein
MKPESPNIYQRRALPGNSLTARREDASQKKDLVKPVISGAQQNIQKSGFFAEAGKALWENILQQTILPNIKRGLYEVGNAALSGALFGSNALQTNMLPFNPRAVVPVRQQPVNQYQRMPQPAQSLAPPEGVDADLGQIIVQSAADAEALLKAAQAYIREYSEISVCKLAEMAGLQAPYTGNEWGYYTMRGSKYEPKGAVWVITLPAPTYLKQ